MEKITLEQLIGKGSSSDDTLLRSVLKEGVKELVVDTAKELLPSIIEEFKQNIKDQIEDFKNNSAYTGREGKPGKTPMKGIDYLTPKEIQDFAQQLLQISTPRKGEHYNDGEQGLQGEKGEQGKDGKEGKPGKDGSPDTGEQIIKKINQSEGKIDTARIQDTPKDTPLFGGRLGRGTGNPLYATDLSASLDGSTKTFPLPVNTRVVSVHSSSTPFVFRETTDYTVSGTTLTFTSGVDAPSMLASGQSLIVLYIQ